MIVTCRRRVSWVLALGIVVLVVHAVRHRYQLSNTLSYVTRPLWDTEEMPDTILKHVWASGLELSESVCELHGWKLREARPQVFDAVLFSTELDLLELRWNELDSVVDKFFLIESEHTFTGLPKDAVFAQHAEEPRFVRFKHKLVHTIMPAPVPGTPPFTYENAHRSAMTELLGANGADNATLVIMADVDELPSAETVRLLQGCEGWGTRVHLLLRNFIYSYEWELVRPSWRAAIEVWGPGAYYGHGIKKGEVVALSNSGWHCSFCFRTIEEFSLKMIGYSHADRVGGDHSLLDPERIQNTICQGGDVFNMLPEAYSYHDMYALTHLKPHQDAIGFPRYLVEHWESFFYLLPGGCIRRGKA